MTAVNFVIMFVHWKSILVKIDIRNESDRLINETKELMRNDMRQKKNRMHAMNR